mmetsp:Transcript_26125/g.56566  ORF Transcript_26125/g.56566 Transcript_26125/m.56566 type:complete len:338 (+) Transcript_26125:363-1376(+)
MPSAAGVGVAASFLWTAQGAYVTRNANLYQKAKKMPGSAIGMFQGWFWLGFQSTNVSGNVTAGILLSAGDHYLTLLMAIYLGCGVAGCLLATTLRQVVEVDDNEEEARMLPEDSEEPKSTNKPTPAATTTIDQLSLTYRLWANPKLQLLIPILLYSGLEQGFIWGDFTANYVKPALTKANVGYVMAVYGMTDALASLAFGKISDMVGRTPIMLLGTSCQIGVMLYFLIGDVPTSNSGGTWAVLVVCACLWGIGDATMNTQLSAILGDEFPDDKEAAFANFKLFQSLMTSVSFFYNSVAPKVVKLGIMLGLVALGDLFYLGLTAYKKAQRNKGYGRFQ